MKIKVKETDEDTELWRKITVEEKDEGIDDGYGERSQLQRIMKTKIKYTDDGYE